LVNVESQGSSPVDRRPSPARISGFTAACVLVSNVIGGGIFTTTGFLARDLGDAGLILFVWVVGALLAIAGALCYSELGAALPHVGGDYLYLRRAYGPFPGFLSGWASFTVGFSAAIAAGSVSFAAYVWQLFSPGREAGLTGHVIALALLWALTIAHLAGIGFGGLLQRVLTISKVGAILLLILGAAVFGRGSWEHFAPSEAIGAPGVGAVAVALIFVMYAYSGWNAAGYIAGEIADAGWALPRAMVWGVLFVGAVYLLLNLVYLYALPLRALAAAPVLPVAEKSAVALFGPEAARLITVMLCVSIAAAVSAMVWAGPRVYDVMARDGYLPRFLVTSGADGTPTRAILLQSAWASILILSGTFEQLVVYGGLVLTAFSALTASAVIMLRRREPDLPRPFRVPLYPLVPCLYILAALLIMGYGLIERPGESAVALGTLLAGAPFYLFRRTPHPA
jgi:APA family basic amino acid/polyamine antiporter